VSNAEVLRDEILGSRDDLQEWLGSSIRYFAFPYGQPAHLNREAFRLARAAEFAGVCSAYGGYNFPGEDAFHLQRLHGDPHFPRLKNWLTFEPRFLFRGRRFQDAVSDPTSPAAPR
jgi:hypothetical protein